MIISYVSKNGLLSLKRMFAIMRFDLWHNDCDYFIMWYVVSLSTLISLLTAFIAPTCLLLLFPYYR